MRRSIYRIITAVLLVILGIALLFVSAGRKKDLERYQAVRSVVTELSRSMSNRAMAYTRFIVSYSFDGQDYKCEVEEPFSMVEGLMGSERTVYIPADAPGEAISPSYWEQMVKKAPVPGIIGWLAIAAAVLIVLWHGTDMLPEWHRSPADAQRPNPLYTGRIEVYRSEPAYDTRPEIGLKYLLGRRRYKSRSETAHAKPIRVEMPEDKDRLVQDIQNDPRGSGILRL